MVSLLEECRQLGVELWVEDDRLKWRAPSATMDDELKGQLREHKAEIIQALAVSRDTRDNPPEPTKPTEPPRYPLSPDPPDQGYLECVSFWPDSYQRRWREVADANRWKGMTPEQAEWAAFLRAVDAINEAQARGVVIEFRQPETQA